MPDYHDASLPIETRVEALLAQMTLAEKIGQMTQAEKNSLPPDDVTQYFIGSVLSGGGGHPPENTVAAWAAMVDGYQQAALKTRLAIPMLYGVDAVHGHNNLYGATIFPHQIGLGAAGDEDLIARIARATAEEMVATGIYWDFAPVVAVPQDIRWGRTYEGYGENTELVTRLGVAYVRGMQTPASGDTLFALATPKHFIGDGATVWGTSTTNQYKLDQGDMQLDEATIRTLLLPPYQAVVNAGALSIMVSFNSWNGLKLHGHPYLLTDVLKNELGFRGFLISDWQAIDQISPDYYTAMVASINAGLDMVMTPFDYKKFIETLTSAVNKGDVPLARIDDAVRRILRVKLAMGLFEHPFADPALAGTVGSHAHRALAREAVRKSLVLLKNENHALPLAKDAPLIFVGGDGANNIGLQSGGWTMEWLGGDGNLTPGTTLLDAVRQTVSPNTTVEYNRLGQFETFVDAQGQPLMADVGLAVIAEKPYAEGMGDEGNLNLSAADKGLVERMHAQSKKLVVVIYSGRPLILGDAVQQAEAWVAAWLPGTEGAGVADVLFGDYDFTGKLPYTWPRRNDQLPLNSNQPLKIGCDGPLFIFGYGLSVKDKSPEIEPCP